MSGQVLDSCTTGLRSFSAVSRRSAALSRSALDSTLVFSRCLTDSIGATGLVAQAPTMRLAHRNHPISGRGCAGHAGETVPALSGFRSTRKSGLRGDAQLSHRAIWLRIRARIGNSAVFTGFGQPKGRKRAMRTRDFLLSTTFAVTFLLLPAALPAQAQSALIGVVTSTEE